MPVCICIGIGIGGKVGETKRRVEIDEEERWLECGLYQERDREEDRW